MKPQLNIDLHDAIDKAGSGGKLVLTIPSVKESNHIICRMPFALFFLTKSVFAKTAR